MKELPAHKMNQYILPGVSKGKTRKKKFWKVIVSDLTTIAGLKIKDHIFGKYARKRDAIQAIDNIKNNRTYRGSDIRIEEC